MTKHYENLSFMAHLNSDGFVSRRLLRKFASMGIFYQRIRRYSSRYITAPVLRIGDSRASKQERTLYSIFELSFNAIVLWTIANEIMLMRKLIDRAEIDNILRPYRNKVVFLVRRTVKYPFGWRIVRFSLFCDNQCIIIEYGECGYEIIGYYIKASRFTSIDCIPEKYLPEYRKFNNFY